MKPLTFLLLFTCIRPFHFFNLISYGWWKWLLNTIGECGLWRKRAHKNVLFWSFGSLIGQDSVYMHVPLCRVLLRKSNRFPKAVFLLSAILFLTRINCVHIMWRLLLSTPGSYDMQKSIWWTSCFVPLNVFIFWHPCFLHFLFPVSIWRFSKLSFLLSIFVVSAAVYNYVWLLFNN